MILNRSLEQEHSNDSSTTAESITDALDDMSEQSPAQSPILWYLGLRAADAFYSKHGRYPGDTDAAVKQDAALLYTELQSLTKALGLSSVAGLSKGKHSFNLQTWIYETKVKSHTSSFNVKDCIITV